MNSTERLAQLAATLRFEEIPDRVIEKAKVTLLHNVGVALAGESLARHFLDTALECGQASAGSQLLGRRERLHPESAAFVTAAMMHARTQDDTYLPGATHAGSSVIPALLALGDRYNVSGRALLTAMVAGYEVLARASLHPGYPVRVRGFRPTSVFGAVGAAAAGANLLRLDERAAASAIGIAAGTTGGTNQTWLSGTDEFQVQVAVGSRTAVSAVMLAARGVTGATDGLEGKEGAWLAFGGAMPADPPGDPRETGEWLIEDVSYKPYPVCALMQVPVTALLELCRDEDIDTTAVRSTRVWFPSAVADGPGTDEAGPFEGVGSALMSAQFCMGVALANGTVRRSDVERFDDPRVAKIARTIEVLRDDSLGSSSCRVTLERTDGSTATREYIGDRTTFNWERGEVQQRQQALHKAESLPERWTAVEKQILDIEGSIVADLLAASAPD